VQHDSADMTDQAIAWHLRLADAGAVDWAAFITWLEADAGHPAAYDRIAMADRAITADHFPTASRAGNDNAPSAVAPRHRWRWIAAGTGVAAALAVVLAPYVLPGSSGEYEIATASGERRALTLGDGTRVELSGDTRLRLDADTPRLVALERGEAVFTVHHDSSRPFVVTAGGRTVQDVGTVFNVAHVDQNLSVEVAEGSVVYEPEGAAVMLHAGDGLSVGDKAMLQRTKLAPDSVGGWRRGILTFNAKPLRDVAGALHRLYGFRIDLSPGLSDRPFTGMVRFSGTADRDVPHLAELIGATWRRDEGRWVLAEAAAR